MNTWNDPVQYQMLLDALNFGNNSIVGLPREFINRYKAEAVVTVPVANGLVTTAADIPKQDLTNFLLAILLQPILLTWKIQQELVMMPLV
jgi:hypothetical protein